MVNGAVVINLRSKNLTRIPDTTVIPLTVTTLRLEGNGIERIFSDDLTPFTELRILSMRGVRLRVIEDGAFDHNDKLIYLDLKGSRGALKYLPISFGPPKLYLTIIDLWASINPNIVNFDFRELVALEQLNIGAWRNGVVDPSKLPQNLVRLVLNHIRLYNMPYFAPHTPNLTSLSACGSRLNRIPEYAIIGLMKLERLCLVNNNLRTLPDLYHLPLVRLFLGGNPLECNQSLCWLRMWNYKKPVALSIGAVVCEDPLAVRGTQLMQIHPIDLRCFDGKTLNYL